MRYRARLQFLHLVDKHLNRHSKQGQVILYAFQNRNALNSFLLNLNYDVLNYLESLVHLLHFFLHTAIVVHMDYGVKVSVNDPDFLVYAVQEIDAEVQIQTTGVLTDDQVQDVYAVLQQNCRLLRFVLLMEVRQDALDQFDHLLQSPIERIERGFQTDQR